MNTFKRRNGKLAILALCERVKPCKAARTGMNKETISVGWMYNFFRGEPVRKRRQGTVSASSEFDI
jgi:hypothetical protein